MEESTEDDGGAEGSQSDSGDPGVGQVTQRVREDQGRRFGRRETKGRPIGDPGHDPDQHGGCGGHQADNRRYKREAAGRAFVASGENSLKVDLPRNPAQHQQKGKIPPLPDPEAGGEIPSGRNLVGLP